ncbi:cobalamin B12-binding domain-containing protein [Planococcus sp. 1R117A]|uniref:cobalamin B12-binding domain-containing protein n=1 Tax=Planococcus sp. 1R117A TaxID=3447020 RepID=UPI003EDC4618
MLQPTQLAELFLQGEDMEALRHIQSFLGDHSRKELFDELLTPAMYHIGALWENNEITVADEHLATAICDFVVSAVENRRLAEKGLERKAMVLGPEGEDHYIGLKMVASLFREHGWSVKYLGPNLPLLHALDAAEKWKPDVIALSAALVYRLPLLKNYVKEFLALEHKPAVLVGGRAVNVSNLNSLRSSGAMVVKDLNQLELWIKTGERPENDYEISI